MANFTEKQTEALEMLKKHYPQGVGVTEDWGRAIFDSLIERGTGLVELVPTDETPTGDAYRLTDAGAKAYLEDAEERAAEAGNN
jgi:hypothetical protein